VKSLTSRYFLPLGNVAASLFLGALAFGLFWYYFPDATLQLFKWAGSIREAVVGGYLPARYEVVVRALVDERQIVYMGFVIATRIVVGLLLLPVYKWIDRKPQQEFRV
jgi:hypothetical protein